MSVVYGVSQEGVSKTVSQVGRSCVGARDDLAVTAGSLGLANDGKGLKTQVETYTNERDRTLEENGGERAQPAKEA